MDGMTRSQVDALEVRDLAADRRSLRPRDAASLILLDRTGRDLRVLMGRRHMRHTFMPGKLVFPGGRTDPADGRVAIADGLHPEDEKRLGRMAGRVSAARLRAIALSAVRETYEETGLLVGEAGDFASRSTAWQPFVAHGVRPSIGALRFIARATTPPNRVRRYDTRFFACWRDDVAVTLPHGGPTGELEELVWLPLAEARRADIPSITGTVLDELSARLADSPQLDPGNPVPFYHMVGNRFVRDLL